MKSIGCMETKLRFRVLAPDSRGASIDGEIVMITVEVATLEEDLRDLILMHVAPDFHKHESPSGRHSFAKTLPMNRWSAEPMDICHGELSEGEITARGVWKDIETFVPDLITAKKATLEALVEAILDDEKVLYGEDQISPETPEEDPDDEPDDGDKWKYEG